MKKRSFAISFSQILIKKLVFRAKILVFSSFFQHSLNFFWFEIKFFKLKRTWVFFLFLVVWSVGFQEKKNSGSDYAGISWKSEAKLVHFQNHAALTGLWRPVPLKFFFETTFNGNPNGWPTRKKHFEQKITSQNLGRQGQSRLKIDFGPFSWRHSSGYHFEKLNIFQKSHTEPAIFSR